MSLTTDELQAIRVIVRDEVRHEVRTEIGIVLESHLLPIKNEVKALRNDVKEIYDLFDTKAYKTIHTLLPNWSDYCRMADIN